MILFDPLNSRSIRSSKALSQPEIIFNYIACLYKCGSGLFSNVQAAEMSQLKTVSLLLKADSSEMVHIGPLLSGTNRHGRWVETCCENTDESLHCCCLSTLFRQLLCRRSCLLKDRNLHRSTYFRDEICVCIIIPCI